MGSQHVYRLFIDVPSHLLCRYPDICIFPLLSLGFLLALRFFSSLASSLAAWLTVGERTPGNGASLLFRGLGGEEDTADDEEEDEDLLNKKEAALVQPGRRKRSLRKKEISCLDNG